MKSHQFPIYCLLAFITACIPLQKPDRNYDVTVKKPTFITEFPKILYDEAHLNTHRASGTYKPFIDLITNDGYEVSVNKERFSIKILGNCDLLIICNAKSHKSLPRDVGAFTKEECKIVNQWVKNGGSLLLIADHHPFGLANRSLALTFGVEMGGGTVKDPVERNGKQNGQIEFSRSNGLLKDHRITNGYGQGEKVTKVVSFTGQSLKGNVSKNSFLRFGENATEVRPDSIWVEKGKNYISFAKPVSVAGLSQAIAIEYGRGRVVILGEAAMLSAQKFFGNKFGMNFPEDSDNRQFALNVVHWLTEKKL